MLNKELLHSYSDSIVYIESGHDSFWKNTYGYLNPKDTHPYGKINKIPYWENDIFSPDLGMNAVYFSSIYSHVELNWTYIFLSQNKNFELSVFITTPDLETKVFLVPKGSSSALISQYTVFQMKDVGKIYKLEFAPPHRVARSRYATADLRPLTATLSGGLRDAESGNDDAGNQDVSDKRSGEVVLGRCLVFRSICKSNNLCRKRHQDYAVLHAHRSKQRRSGNWYLHRDIVNETRENLRVRESRKSINSVDSKRNGILFRTCRRPNSLYQRYCRENFKVLGIPALAINPPPSFCIREG